VQRVGDRTAECVCKIDFGIGGIEADGLLGACEDDGLSGALNKIGQSGSRIGHGVGAVADDEAVIVEIAAADRLCELQPVDRGQVGAVEAEQLQTVDFAERADIGDKGQKLLRRELGNQSVLAPAGRDGAAGADHENVFHGESSVKWCL